MTVVVSLLASLMVGAIAAVVAFLVVDSFIKQRSPQDAVLNILLAGAAFTISAGSSFWLIYSAIS